MFVNYMKIIINVHHVIKIWWHRNCKQAPCLKIIIEVISCMHPELNVFHRSSFLIQNKRRLVKYEISRTVKDLKLNSIIWEIDNKMSPCIVLDILIFQCRF